MTPGRLPTVLHRNCLAIKWPRGAWLLLSGMWPHAGIKQHVTNIFQLQFSWVLLGAHKIQEYCHVLGQLSSTATAVSCNMWQLSKTFAQSGPSNIHQASRCQSEIQWIQIFKLDPLYFAYILHICSHHNCKCAWSQAIDTAGVEQEWIFSPSFAYKVTIWSWQFKNHFPARSSCQEIQGWSRNVTPKSPSWSLKIARRVSASVLPASGTEVAFFNSSKLARVAAICAKLSSKDCLAVCFCCNLRSAEGRTSAAGAGGLGWGISPLRGSNSGAVHKALSSAWDFGFFKNLLLAQPACTAAP